MLRSGRRYDMPLSIDGGHHGFPDQLDPMSFVVAGVLDPVRLVPLAEEQSLGQWWSLVRQVIFRANQHHLAVEAPPRDAPTMTMRDGAEAMGHIVLASDPVSRQVSRSQPTLIDRYAAS